MSISRRAAVLVAIVMTVAPTSAWALNDIDGWNPSTVEATMLPRFCWGQFMKNRFRGPEFTIQGCGGGMNHYCPGLVALNRANRSFDMRAKLGYLQGARDQILYTIHAMKKHSDLRCPIRAQVLRTYHLIELELNSRR